MPLRTEQRTAAILFALAVAGSLVGGCAQTERTEPADPPVPTATSATTAVATPSSESAAQPGVNAQGRLSKKIGEDAGFSGEDGTARIVTFSIDKIVVDPKCDQYMTRPAGLHTLVLDIRVATGKLAAGDIAQLGATINPFAFQQVSASGITTPAQASTCKATSQRQLPANWAPNSKYSGQLALDVPEANGVLALIPSGMSAPGGGWEWQY